MWSLSVALRRAFDVTWGMALSSALIRTEVVLAPRDGTDDSVRGVAVVPRRDAASDGSTSVTLPGDCSSQIPQMFESGQRSRSCMRAKKPRRHEFADTR